LRPNLLLGEHALMCLNHFLNDLEIELEELFWRDNPRRLQAEKVCLLKQQAENLREILAEREFALGQLDQKIAAFKEQEGQIAERIGIYLRVADRQNAWRLALELDGVRKRLGSLRHQAMLQQGLKQKENAWLEQVATSIAACSHK